MPTTGTVVLPTVNVAVSPDAVTESGSANLVYTLSRTGDASGALTVDISLSGTAAAADYTSNISLASGSEPVKAWTKLLGSSGADYAYALTTGLDGSIYVSGVTYGALDGQTSNGSDNAFLTKYSADGTKAWTKLLATNKNEFTYAYAVTTGLDGSIYVSGSTYGALDGQTNNGEYDAFLTKYSVDGTKAWTRLLGTSGHEHAYALTTGLDGSIYVSGVTSGALDGQTSNGGAFLTKYSSDGIKAWTKMLGSSSARALTTGLDGSIYVSGSTSGSLDGQTNSGGSDAFLTKYSADGTKAWTKLLGTSLYEAAMALTTGLDGSIYLSGRTDGALDGLTNSGATDAFLIKYSADGTKAWTKLLGSNGYELANALTTGLDGSIYVSGSTSGSLDGQTNNGSADEFLTSFSGSLQFTNDAFLTKFSVSPQITFAAGAATATLLIDPTADNFAEGNETLTVTVLAGTGYVLGSSVVATGTIDDSAPTLAITSSASILTTGQTAAITFTFSELPSSFAASDITTTGGTLSGLAVSSSDTKVYTTTFTPTASLASGSASITVASASYTDAAGNSGGAGTTPAISIDTLAPTVTSFSPTDEAAAIAIANNIVLTFSEAIAKGTGNIVLKTVAGVTVATYDAETSSNLSISGSTLTINPTADLGYSTGYKVEFAEGSIKDLLGNSYAGTTDYNFTTAAAPNIAPIAIATSITTNEDTVKTGTLTATDVDSSSLTFVKVANPTNGTVVVNQNGSYTYTPIANFNGTDTFTFKANDGALDSVAASVSIAVLAVNDLPIGSVTLSGTATQGQVLTASNNLADADGLGTISYQWLADGNNISGATSATFTLTQSQVGKAISVKASYTDLLGSAESVNSFSTSLVIGFAVPTFWKDNTKAPTEIKKVDAVNLTDAIAILKMIVGLNVNSNNTPLSPYQAIAADFDQSGDVGLTDAIGVLKMVVGLSAPTPTWKYYDDTKLNSTYTSAQSLNPKGWTSTAVISDTGTADSSVKLIGVLTGDVDGSWSGT